MRARISTTQYPLCATCGTRVKGRDNRYCCQGCIPKSIRQAACRKGRKTYAYRRRAILLKRYLDRLSGRSITREELIDVLWEYGKTQYHNGYHVGRADGSLQDAKERQAA